MKTFLFLIALLATSNAQALTVAEETYLLNRLTPVARKVGLGDKIAAAKKIAKVVIETTTADGSSTFGSIGLHSTGVVLPAGAIITRSYYKTNTQFTDAGSGTVALNCETGDNILAAADITGEAAESLHEGVSTGAATAFKKVTNACTIYMAIAAADQTAGKLTLFVEYSLGE